MLSVLIFHGVQIQSLGLIAYLGHPHNNNIAYEQLA